MKKFTITPVLFITLLMAHYNSVAATYTALKTGKWSCPYTWGGPSPSFTNTKDTIIIPSGIEVLADSSAFLNGDLAHIIVSGKLVSSAGTLFSVSPGIMDGNGTISLDNLTFGPGARLPFAGSIFLNKLFILKDALTTGATVSVVKTLTLEQGNLTLEKENGLFLAGNAKIIIAGGQLKVNGGLAELNNQYDVIYTEHTTSTGMELQGKGLRNLTINLVPAQSLNLSSDLSLHGLLLLKSGTLDLDGHNLSLKGDVGVSGDGSLASSAASSINLICPGGITGDITFSGANNEVNNLTVDLGKGKHVQITGNLAIKGILNMKSGILILNKTNLALEGKIMFSENAKFASSVGSNITIATLTTSADAIYFSPPANVVDNLFVNVADGGFVNLGSDLVIKKCLNLVKGHLDIGSNLLVMGETASVTGGRKTSYIVTSGNGFLAIPLRAGTVKSTVFPIGTRSHYFPASVQLNKGSSEGMILMRVSPASDSLRYPYGIFSALVPSVDAFFFIQSDISSNINMNLQLAWPSDSGTNGFKCSKAGISNYIAGNWDVVSLSSATPAEEGMNSLTRKNITSLGLFSVFDKSVIPHIQRISADADFKLVFNQVLDYIHITNKTGIDPEINVRITDINGRLITAFKYGKAASGFSLIGIKPGDYVVQLYNDKINIAKKFTKVTMQSMMPEEYRPLRSSEKSLKGRQFALIGG